MIPMIISIFAAGGSIGGAVATWGAARYTHRAGSKERKIMNIRDVNSELLRHIHNYNDSANYYYEQLREYTSQDESHHVIGHFNTSQHNIHVYGNLITQQIIICRTVHEANGLDAQYKALENEIANLQQHFKKYLELKQTVHSQHGANEMDKIAKTMLEQLSNRSRLIRGRLKLITPKSLR